MRQTLIVFLAVLCSAGAAFAGVSDSGADAFARLVIQHQGRLKPMDTFARDQLLTYYHRTTFQGRSASAWALATMAAA